MPTRKERPRCRAALERLMSESGCSIHDLQKGRRLRLADSGAPTKHWTGMCLSDSMQIQANLMAAEAGPEHFTEAELRARWEGLCAEECVVEGGARCIECEGNVLPNGDRDSHIDLSSSHYKRPQTLCWQCFKKIHKDVMV